MWKLQKKRTGLGAHPATLQNAEKNLKYRDKTTAFLLTLCQEFWIQVNERQSELSLCFCTYFSDKVPSCHPKWATRLAVRKMKAECAVEKLSSLEGESPSGLAAERSEFGTKELNGKV
jgi:hypothetical protein